LTGATKRATHTRKGYYGDLKLALSSLGLNPKNVYARLMAENIDGGIGRFHILLERTA
jgi:hypothetical protein